MRSIMPVELSVESVDGTWKLNQNKEDQVRLRAATASSRATAWGKSPPNSPA